MGRWEYGSARPPKNFFTPTAKNRRQRPTSGEPAGGIPAPLFEGVTRSGTLPGTMPVMRTGVHRGQLNGWGAQAEGEGATQS